jgi:adenylate cyclase
MPDTETKSWVTSKEILEKTGISRATLNNYIKSGLIPKPVVKKSPDNMDGVKKIGYFPEAAMETVYEVKRLKREGNSMKDIVRKLSDAPANLESFRNHQREGIAPPRGYASSSGDLGRKADKGVKLTLDSIGSAAYLINNNFEIEWINREAVDEIFRQDVQGIDCLESRNLFKILFGWEFHDHISNWKELVAYHMAFAKTKMNRRDIPHIYSGISDVEIKTLESIYDEQPSFDKTGINKTGISLEGRDGSVKNYEIYSVTFREGELFVYFPADSAHPDFMKLLSGRGDIIDNLMKQRMPSLVSFCVLVADLQDSVKISAELPPVEYFELINQICKSLSGLFGKYHGIYGKHAGDGMLYYFIKKPKSNYISDAICCALEIREMVKKISYEWKMRKGWLNNLYLNIGINEGKEYFGTIQSASNLELTALGDSINYAGRLSDFARSGGILVTKNMINKLSPEELRPVRFGIRRAENGREIFIERSFSRILDLIDSTDQRYSKFQDIFTLPVTEIVGYTNPDQHQAGFPPDRFIAE